MQQVMNDVEIRGAYKKFGTNVVLGGVDLDVKQGELLTLLGPSGCGKTTTLNLIAGFIDADQGELYIKGKRMNGVPPYKRDLGMVFQGYSLFPHMTVYENLEFGLKLHKVDKTESGSRIKNALEIVKMTGLEQRYPRELSGGQRQRVAIARALVVQPKLLLLDEPLSNLDAKLRQELRMEIKRLQKEVGVTTIFVTHDQEEALSMSDRIVIMDRGKVEQVGTPTEIYANPRSEFVFNFIGKSNSMHGSIVHIDANNITVQRENGEQMLVEAGNVMGADRLCSIGDQVKLYIRPEKVAIGPVSDADYDLHTVRITQMNYLGSSWEIFTSFQGDSLQVQCSDIDPAWTIGSEVKIGWKPSDVMLIKQ
ncbi:MULTISPECIES: ABC transporter ATP-binding protein [Paenibacillus]|uniref:Spermidine/putrescine ABC transporter ATP-binding protein n=1 Tax=Paenibacillus naphthalenovorans TaxID=162209 RepID=A0A0U2W8R7_9BACL|nr:MULTISPECIES: ABC transporter ATP-binding protein [Paenibacillus]ALS23909.1 spermidine/putrescine ABC transporter ATP-binding protein [Paenibacillus naphthalenovorans]NTZ16265.1 ABC transporter ATP-binding protein [Paenibacillus sp. JMULE4]GCL72139.1 ABC transporter ATP-binding protein [Paenibacillus naphthalenovorans]SDI99398.1 putative spermidine/putrescine transport system ATP-binding protein [Paenibacillus naphthalenovorans]